MRQTLRKYHFIRKLYKYARDTHWLESAVTKVSIGENGLPCPWLPYGVIRFLDSRPLSDLRVFEYGSGNSTKWWAERAKSVVSVEHDKDWFDTMNGTFPENVRYIFKELEENGAYSDQIREFSEETDLVVIDGRDRVNCALKCLSAPSPPSAILWDNTDRLRYEPGMIAITNAGYRRIDFFGHAPINIRPSQTTVFYKRDNCLGI